MVLVGCGKPSNPEADRVLIDAVKQGNIEAVKYRLSIGTDIELKCTGCGSTALGHAAKHGHNEIAELLIVNGADVSAKSLKGLTPLHYAAVNGHKEIAELLIAKGADVYAKSEGGETPLVYAVAEGQEEVVDLLIAAGTDVNTKDGFGDTSLDWAILFKQTKIANLLRKHGGKTGEELKAEGK